ncbi:MAG: putative toxin-antitoxin system toxin component, PIN family [Chloracidobacterium sp.]|nr:putative toxin-antitoxin system toxin component, PIN family [Chloracidobacterium sp.]MCO5332534.1 putative toxin-antitoxin system toxin component, PIN family [Pyrinomonadaceae bacterium]
MIRVVIDTGVVVSAAFRDRTPEQLVLFVSESKDHEWVVSPSILKEYNEVLARKKFALPDEILTEWQKKFEQFTTRIEPNITVDFQRDRTDTIFLECAIAAEAKYLVSGDKDLEDAVDLVETTIIDVSQFMALVAN